MKTLNDFLSEGQGLTNRKPGETFVDKDGNALFFKKIEFYKKDEYDGDLSAVTFVNKQIAGLMDIGVVTFKNSAGTDVLFGKYTKSAKWDNSNPGFFDYKSKAIAKEQSGLKPTDFLKPLTNLTPEHIKDQIIKSFGKDSPLVLAIQETMADGHPKTPIPIGELSETAITNYFAEILHPIALTKGKFIGNGREGIAAIVGTEDITRFRINFPSGVTQGLYDSYLTSGDDRIELSSKFGTSSKSAKASVGNLLKIYNNYNDKSHFDEYQTEIEIARIIGEESMIFAPLYLSQLMELITKDELKLCLQLYKGDAVELTPKLIKMRDSMKPLSTPVPYYHLLAGIAKTVCAHINKNTQFSRFASLLLNGTVIQVYTKTTTRNNTIIFRPFETKWPDDAVTNVLLESGTRYKANRVDGKIGYMITSK